MLSRHMIIAALAMAASAAIGVQSASANLISGDLAVLRIGSNGLYSTTAANPVYIDDYSTTGVLMSSNLVTGVNSLTLSASSTAEGQLNLSVNKQYLTFFGYNAAPGTAGVSSATGIPRDVGIMDYTGATDTSTSFAYGTAAARSAVSNDGTNLWVGGSSSGVSYILKGSATATPLITAPTNVRSVTIFNSQLYVDTGSGTGATGFYGPATIGSGLPTTAVGGPAVLLPGFPNVPSPGNTLDTSPYDYSFADGGNTIYLADDGAATGGLQKWTFNGTTWTQIWVTKAGLTSATTYIRSIASITTDGVNDYVYAISTDSKLVLYSDPVGSTSVTSTFTTLATAPSGYVFRGVDFAPVPEPTSLSLLALGAGGLMARKRRR